MRRLVLAMTAIAAISGFAGSAAAQSFPSRPITMIVPFAAGGPTDVIARVVGERMGQSLGQPVVIENVTGAGGTIAAGRVARAAPDGYTLDLATWSTHVVTPVLYQLQYDVFRDFDPVVWLTQTPLLLVSRKDIPANDLQGTGRLAEEQIRPRAARQRRRHRSGGGLFAPATDSRENPGRAVSRAGAGDAGFVGRAHRSAVRPAVRRDAADSQRHDQGLRRHPIEPRRGRARYSDGRRGGIAGPAHHAVAFAVGAEGHAAGGHRQAQCRGHGRARRCRRAQPSRPSAKKSCRASGRRRKRLRLITSPKPTHGGRSSRPPASRRSSALV